jgi:hypothetical protein
VQALILYTKEAQRMSVVLGTSALNFVRDLSVRHGFCSDHMRTLHIGKTRGGKDRCVGRGLFDHGLPPPLPPPQVKWNPKVC